MKPEERDPHSEADWRWTLLLATAAGVARLIPHPWNFTPVGALGLFTGSRLRPGSPLWCRLPSWRYRTCSCSP